MAVGCPVQHGALPPSPFHRGVFMAKWVHLRKGLLIGEIVREHDDTIDIKLENKVVGASTTWLPGEAIRVSKHMLKSVDEGKEERTGG